MEAFLRTDPPLNIHSMYYYHTQTSPIASQQFSSSIIQPGTERDPIQTFDAFKTSIQNNRPVILFLDSYSVSSSTKSVNVEDETIEIFDLQQFAQSGTQSDNNDYIEDTENPGNAVGHTVVLVGYHETAGCKYVIVQDNEGTTPRFVALAFNDVYCGGGGGVRALFPNALLASFFVDPLGQLLPIVPSSLPSPPPPSSTSPSPVSPPTSPSPVSPPTSSSLSLSPPPSSSLSLSPPSSSPPSPRPPFAPLSASQAVVETQATVMSIRFTVDATLETFASQDFETALRTKTQCEPPSCFLQMDVSAGSVIVDARFIVPNTQPSDTVDEIQTATEALVPADFPNATNMTEVVTRTNVTLPIVVDIEPSPPFPPPLSIDHYDMLTLYLVSTFTFLSFLMAIVSFGWHRMKK